MQRRHTRLDYKSCTLLRLGTLSTYVLKGCNLTGEYFSGALKMKSRLKYFFVDTNLFLQCRDIKNLPWKEISAADEINLIIPRTVQVEIDRLKSDGNGRRAKRARTTSAYFRDILLSDNEQLILCSFPPITVTITFSPSITPPDKQLEVAVDLDANRPDDSILFEIIAYRTANPDRDVTLLTHDTNPLVTAKRLGIPFQVIPDDWLLAPESDERDKEIRALKARNDELEKRTPQIEISLIGNKEEELRKVEAVVYQYPEFSSRESDLLIEQVKLAYPMRTNFENDSKKQNDLSSIPHIKILGSSKYIPPPEIEITKYQQIDYPDWLESVAVKLNELPKHISKRNNGIKVSLSLSNSGNVPAEHLIFRLEVSDGFVILPPSRNGKQEHSDSWSFPSPPAGPQGRYEEHGFLALSRMLASENLFAKNNNDYVKSLHSGSVGSSARDRNGFYYKQGRPIHPKALWEFECDEFLHKGKPETFLLELGILQISNVVNGKLKCSVMGKNIPSPTIIDIPLIVSIAKGNTFEAAYEYMKPSFFKANSIQL